MIERKLNNGITVVGQKFPFLRSATIGIWAGAGSASETPSENGLSHFIEHMLFKGTDRRSAKQISVDVDNIGGQMNAMTSKESTCYYIRVMDENLPEAVDILTDIFSNSVLPPDELEKERGVVLEEIAMSRDMLDDLVVDNLARNFFGDTSLGRTILGPAENIRGFSRDDLMNYMARHYTPENIVVAIAGNFDEERTIDQLNESLSDVGSRPVHIAPKAAPDDFSTARPFSYVQKEAEQTHMSFGFPATSLAPEDEKSRYALEVLNNIIGGSMSSRLFQKIREEKGMAYSVYSHPALYKHTGMFEVYAGTMPQNAEVVTQMILEELSRLRKDGVTREEFEQSKRMLKGHLVLQMESTSSRMVSLGRTWLAQKRVRTQDELLKLIDDVTFEEVSDQIGGVTDIDKMSAAYVGPDENGEQLETIIEEARRAG